MDGKDSLYKKISSALLEDGTLPKDFELVPKEEGQIAFAPGAADGIAYFHTRLQEPSGEQLTLMADAVWASSVSEYDRAEELFEQLGKAIAFPCILGTLQKNTPVIQPLSRSHTAWKPVPPYAFCKLFRKFRIVLNRENAEIIVFRHIIKIM